MPDWPEQTWAEIKVPTADVFYSEKSIIPSVTFTPDNAPRDEVVYLNQLPTCTESKTIKRTINFIGKKLNGQTVSLGNATQSITLNREVYTDIDGSKRIKRDWNTGTLREYIIPDKTGYIKQQEKVPAIRVNVSDKDITINVFFLENYTGAKWENSILTYFENGIKSSTFTGIATTTAGNKVYFVNGIFQKSFTGIVKDNNGSYLLFKKGIFAKSFKNAKWINGNLYYFDKGVLNNSISNIVETESGNLVLFKNGVFQKKFTGIVNNSDGKRMLFRKGILDKHFTGAKWIDGVLYYFQNGILNETITGIATTESGRKVIFIKGVFQKNFSGFYNSIYFEKGIEK